MSICISRRAHQLLLSRSTLASGGRATATAVSIPLHNVFDSFNGSARCFHYSSPSQAMPPRAGQSSSDPMQGKIIDDETGEIVKDRWKRRGLRDERSFDDIEAAIPELFRRGSTSTPSGTGTGNAFGGKSPRTRKSSPHRSNADSNGNGQLARTLSQQISQTTGSSSSPSFSSSSRHFPRMYKGVHTRRDRSRGQTPEEANVFNKVLAGLFKDLEKMGGPLRPGSSPITDPFGNQIGGVGLFGSSNGAQGGLDVEWGGAGMRGLISAQEEADVKAELDELKEEISRIASESELVQWAQDRVFTPRRQASTASTTDEPSFSRSYPHILAYLIQYTRDQFKNPSLSLAFFQHAQTLSLESYISGCLTPAYNELLKTRWESFGDIEGVSLAVKEMEANGVMWDRHTQKLVGGICETLSQSAFVAAQTMGRNTQPLGSMWRDHVASRWRALEQRVQVDLEMEDGVHERMQEAKRMARFGAGLTVEDEATLESELEADRYPRMRSVRRTPSSLGNVTTQVEEELDRGMGEHGQIFGQDHHEHLWEEEDEPMRAYA